MRFKVDENMPVESADLLRRAGHEATTVSDQKLTGSKDPQIASVCRAEDRALISMDLDFANIRTFPPADHPGIVIMRLGFQEIEHILHVFGRVLEALKVETLRGCLWVVDESSLRIRKG